MTETKFAITARYNIAKIIVSSFVVIFIMFSKVKGKMPSNVVRDSDF